MNDETFAILERKWKEFIAEHNRNTLQIKAKEMHEFIKNQDDVSTADFSLFMWGMMCQLYE